MKLPPVEAGAHLMCARAMDAPWPKFLWSRCAGVHGFSDAKGAHGAAGGDETVPGDGVPKSGPDGGGGRSSKVVRAAEDPERFQPKMRLGRNRMTPGTNTRTIVTLATATNSSADSRVYSPIGQRRIEHTAYMAAPTGGVKLPIVAATMKTIPKCTGSPLSCWMSGRKIGVSMMINTVLSITNPAISRNRTTRIITPSRLWVTPSIVSAARSGTCS